MKSSKKSKSIAKGKELKKNEKLLQQIEAVKPLSLILFVHCEISLLAERRQGNAAWL